MAAAVETDDGGGRASGPHASFRVRVDGEVEGDVTFVGREIEIGPTAWLRGHLIYTSLREARIDPAARIEGPNRWFGVPDGTPHERGDHREHEGSRPVDATTDDDEERPVGPMPGSAPVGAAKGNHP